MLKRIDWMSMVVTVGLVTVAIVSRLVPHPANFTAVGAVALASGVFLRGRLSMWLPIIVLGASDAIIGFYDFPVMATVYGSFVLIALLGRALQKFRTSDTILLGSLSASLLFFVTTNFAVWAFTPMYAKTGMGLLASYAMAVPFFRTMLVGDLLYTGLIFGVLVCAVRFSKSHQMVPVAL